jgi:hypothetical protein
METLMPTPEPASRERPVRATAVMLVGAVLGCGALAFLFLWASGWLRAHHAGVWAILALAGLYAVAVTAVALTAARLARRVSRIEPSSAAKRYAQRFTAAMMLYVAVLMGVLYAFIGLRVTGPLAYALAAAPALPLIMAIAVIGLYLREETDEFQRAVMVEAALWATGGMLAITTVWGFLETFGLVIHLPSWLAFVVWSVLFGPGQIIARMRYR